MTETLMYSRRQMLKRSVGLAFMASVTPISDFSSLPFRLGACDWSIGKTANVDALAFGRRLGLDGVMVSLGTAANDMHLRQKSVQEKYLRAAREYKIAISSLAIGEMNNIPYKSSPEAEQWVHDSIDVAKAMGCKVVLLAFFNNGDLRGDEDGIKEVIRRLRKVAPKAENAGVTLGIESWLSATEHLDIIHKVGSPNVKVYFDVANSHQMGHDIFEEMRILGRKYICEIHAKENGSLLGKGLIDFVKVRKVLDEIGYNQWIIMEGGCPPNTDVYKAYVENVKYMRSIFS